MFELTLQQKVENSQAIFEGKVTGQKCFWNAEHTLIFTSNIVEVYKVFKGSITNTTVEVITEGGLIGDEMQQIEPNLILSEGDIGIFMAEPSITKDPLNSLNTQAFQCYGSSQGFLKYDLLTKTAACPFKKYNDIANELYPAITNLCGQSYRTLQFFDMDRSITNIQYAIAKSGGSITSFSPTSITAGTNSVLTINGTGFGAVMGSSTVNFKNPDDGGTTYNIASAYHYLLWSDTLIQVRVPAKSGTGTIQVVVSGTPLTSASVLTVKYAESNTVYLNIPYQTDLVNLNGSGGVTWQMNTAFDSNTPAKNAFNRALHTWSSNTSVNWMVGGTTSKDAIARDSVNVVRFDIGNELPAGTLARCYYYWLGCATSVWFVSELDMAVDDGTSWEFGPAAPTGSLYDFESVMLHELGHGHQLGHVINNSDVMHYSTLNGVSNRVLNTNNSAGGNDIMSRSFVANSCGNGPMTPSSVGISTHLNNNTFITYPNPTSGNITIELPEETSMVQAFNYLGEMVASMNTGSSSKKINLDLSHCIDGVYCIVAHVNGNAISENIVLAK